MSENTVANEVGFWEDAEVISIYAPAQGVEDGILMDLTNCDHKRVVEICNDFTKDKRILITQKLAGFIQKAVDNKRWMNDWAGVVGDIIWMAHLPARFSKDPFKTIFFKVIITGASRRKYYYLKRELVPFDEEMTELCYLFSLQEED